MGAETHAQAPSAKITLPLYLHATYKQPVPAPHPSIFQYRVELNVQIRDPLALSKAESEYRQQ